jgi:Ca2+-binding RTX toxin-like protein
MPTIDPPAVRALPLALAALAALFALWLAHTPGPELPFAREGGEVRAERAYGELPLAFEPNAGRAEGGADFVSRSVSGTVLLDSDGATLGLGSGKRTETIGFDLLDATPATPRALDRLPGVVNDLRGDDSQRWRTDIPTFERVRYPGVWPGIDLDYYGNQRSLEYDFRLAPGGDPNEIAFRIKGADRLRLAANGDLLIAAGTETIRQRAPIAYQPAVDGTPRASVSAAFAPSGDTVRFRLGPYDRGRPLVIDPVVLAYSTYLGGNRLDRAAGIAVDDAGAAYVTGLTVSSDFDTVGAIQDSLLIVDAFVSKLTPAGNALEYSTYLGGGGTDQGHAIAVDSAGAAYVTGDDGADVFVAKLTPDGSALSYSTSLGGGATDQGLGIAVDDAGAAYVTGRTESTNFDTMGAIEGNSAGADAFVSKLTPGGALAYSTYLGGNETDQANGIAVDSSGAAYVTGETVSTDFNMVGAIEGNSRDWDAFVSKLTPAGSALAYSTYLGGGAFDEGTGIAVDDTGAAYVTGSTDSSDFNTTSERIERDSPRADAFVSKLVADGSALDYSTYLGGNGPDDGKGIAVDAAGAAYVTGGTGSSDFDTVGEIEGDSGDRDAFVSKLTAAGSALAYSTYLGGGGMDGGVGIAVDGSGGAYVTGETFSTNFNTVGEIEGDTDDQNSDAFISKLTSGVCTITGTAGGDTLVGTAGNDVICGLEGNDTIVGRGGHDELRGEDGRDALIGSTGDDILDGGLGEDRAGYSADATGGVNVNLATGVVSSANLGADTIVQEAGVSTIERVAGSRFDDTLVGDGQDNQLDGADGDDTIVGAGGADSLIGVGGADELSGGGGNDRLAPGAGDDPSVSGGGNSDTLRYANVSGGGVFVDLAAGIAFALGGSDSGTDTLLSDIENAVGTPSNDELSAKLAGTASVLEGLDGADALDTADGDGLDSAKGGAGADTCTTDAGDARSSCP